MKNIQSNFFRPRWQFLLAALCFIVAIISDRSFIDLRLSTFFYDFEKGKFFGQQFYWFDFMYDYLPGIFWITFLLFIFRIFSLYFKKKLPLSKIKVEFFVAFSLLGGVILVDLIKDVIARPRPYQLSLFGGNFDYTHIGIFNNLADVSNLNSFPSGHAVSGYILIVASVFWLKYNRPLNAYLTYTAGIILGILLAFCRIAQGGHFLSDTLGSLALSLFLTGIGILFFISPRSKAKIRQNIIKR